MAMSLSQELRCHACDQEQVWNKLRKRAKSTLPE